MKKIYLLFLINFFFINHLLSQDYFPMELGNYWIYDVLNESGEIIGQDSAVIDSSYMSGPYEIYQLHKYIDTLSGGEDEAKQLFYSNGNDIHSYDLLNAKVAQHSYHDGDSWNISYLSYSIDVVADSIGLDTVPYGIMDSCFRVKSQENEFYMVDVIYAPDIGPIKYYNEGQVARELIRKGKETIHIGIDDVNFESEIRFYPVPVIDVLEIEMPFKSATVKVFDITGTKVYEGIIVGYSTYINLSSLKGGIYFIKIKHADKQIMRKILVR